MDIEAFVVRYLNDSLDYVAATNVPNPRPEKLITVERTGGPESLGIDRPTLAIQCWAPSRAESAALAYEVRDCLEGLELCDEIGSCSINSLYNFPSEKDEPRYQIVIDVVNYS